MQAGHTEPQADRVGGQQLFQAGGPQTGYIPLLALERPRLSVQEVAEVVRSLVIRGVLPIEVTDIWATITEITDDMPSCRR